MKNSSTEPAQWTHDEVARLLTSRTALTDLDYEAARSIVQRMWVRRFAPGTVLMQENVASSGFMMLVLSGEVVIEQQNVRRTDSLILGVVGAGSVLGEMGLLDGEPRSATCKAFTEVDAAVLEREALSTLMQAHPAACAKLLAVLLKRVSERLRVTNRKFRGLSQVNQALMGQLHQEPEPDGEPVYAAHVGPDSGMILL